MKYIMDRVKGLGFHLDIGHAYVNGGLNAVLDYIKMFGPNLWHVHMHDTTGRR